MTRSLSARIIEQEDEANKAMSKVRLSMARHPPVDIIGDIVQEINVVDPLVSEETTGSATGSSPEFWISICLTSLFVLLGLFLFVVALLKH